MASQQQTGRAASRARRELQVSGKGRSAAAPAATRQPNRKERQSVPAVSPAPAPQVAAPVAPSFTAPVSMPVLKRAQKSPSRQRRESLAARGKVADKSRDRQRNQEMLRTAKKTVEAKKGNCGCGGPCCQEAEAKAAAAAAPAATLSMPASSGIKTAKKKTSINANGTGRMLSRARRIAMSGRGKAGLEAHGKSNSSASLARQANPEISSRDLARVVRDSRSKGGACGSSSAAPARGRRPRNAAEAKRISGTKVTHTEKMTGDEAGLCHTGITGTEYMSADVFNKFCMGEAPKAPKKVELTSTLSGGRVTSGGKVGGSAVMTGAEKGSCSNVTGTEYLGKEDFAACSTKPSSAPAKVSYSQTTRGQIISGSKPARSRQVTGNEAGTCKAVTGTPYAGMEQFGEYCEPSSTRMIEARNQRRAANNVGRDITGLQPGIEGVTGVERGECQAISGTPYIGGSEQVAVCGALPAQVGDADFPQPIDGAPWSAFSVEAPMQATAPVAAPARSSSVTGAYSDHNGRISGTFAMGEGKVTGTEQFRFGAGKKAREVSLPTSDAAVEKASRITGEGITTGLKITGDDWNRGERVTGTEGFSAAKRNPTKRGPVSAMPAFEAKRNVETPRGDVVVTGGSGGTDKGAPVTVSGGARG